MLERFVGNFGMLSEAKDKADLDAFFKKRSHEHIEKALKHAIESIDINVKFVENNCFFLFLYHVYKMKLPIVTAN